MWFLGLLGVLMPLSAWAQCGGLVPSQYVVDRWGPKEGLPEERILSITQSRDGFLWLASADALVRYDGKEFRILDQSDLPHLPQVYLRTVYAVKNGGLLVMGADMSVSLLMTPHDRAVVPASPSAILRHVPFRADTKGRTWIPTAGGIFAVENGKGMRVDLEGPRLRGQVNVVQPDGVSSGEGFYLGTSDGEILWVSEKGELRRQWKVPKDVRTMARLANGEIWIGTGDGLYQLTGDTLRKSGEIAVTSIMQDRKGVVWVGTDEGLACREGGRESWFGPPDGLLEDRVHAVYEDREGNVWVAFTTTGLYRVKRPKFPTIGLPEGLPTDRVLAVESKGGHTWIGVDGGLARVTGNKVDLVPDTLEMGRVRTLTIDNSGTVWAASTAKMVRVDPTTLRVSAVSTKDRPQILNLFTRRNGTVLALDASGLFRVEGNRWTPVSVAGLPALTYRSQLAETSDGRLWLSARDRGLYAIDGAAARRVSPGNADWRLIHTVYPDNNGDLWIGFDGDGLGRLRNGQLHRYQSPVGAPLNHLYHISEDRLGNLWFGLRSELWRVSKSYLNAYLDGQRADLPHDVFDMSDGLRSSNFGLSFKPAGNGPSDIVWIPHLRGVLRVDSRSILRNELPPLLVVSGVQGDNAEITAPDGVWRIPSNVRRFEIQISANSLTEPSRVRYRHKLEGFDETWQGPEASGTASYTNVPPGTYTYRVQASNNDGVWNEEGLALTVVRDPAFYQTWPFRIFAAMLLVVAIVLIIWWRTRALQRQKLVLEEHVRARTVELENARVAAEAAAQAKADFLATMSHEIRTPMHGVLGTLELLSATRLDGEQKEHVSVIRTSSSSLLSLLNDILDLSKLEAGRMDLASKPFSLRRKLEEVVRTLQSTAKAKGLGFHLNYQPGVPDHFLGDGTRVRQILFNLAGNAVKFTDSGFVELNVTGKQLTGNAWDLQVAVRDTGIGIPQDRLTKLFQKFYQVDGSFSRRYEGTGLGLAICQKLANAMGGQIVVTSEEGHGSVFSLQLRLRQSQTVPDAPPAETPLEKRFSGRVLLAEDNAVNRRLGESLLRKLGCEVTSVTNGAEAVDHVRSVPFDLVLMDLHMPTMDGLEATQCIRRSPLAARQPVIIAVTANAMEGDCDRCLKAGMDGYLAKPFHVQDLISLLAQYLREESESLSDTRAS